MSDNILTPADLKKFRRDRGLTQAQAAALVGVGSFRTWQDWERGERKIPKWLRKMIDFLIAAEARENDP